MKFTRFILSLVFLVSCIPFLRAAASAGRLELPNSLAWTRAAEADAQYGGLCLEVKGRDGVSNLLVFDTAPAAASTELEQELLLSGYLDGFAKTLKGAPKAELRVAGRQWTGYQQYDSTDKQTLFLGAVIVGQELFKVYLVRQGSTPPSRDLLQFLDGIRIAPVARAGEAARTAPSATKPGAQPSSPSPKHSLPRSPSVAPARQSPPASPAQAAKASASRVSTAVPVSAQATAKSTAQVPAPSSAPAKAPVAAPASSPGKASAALPAWIMALPPLAAPAPAELPQPVDFRDCTRTEYQGLVRQAREATRELLGNLNAADTRRFDEKWEPMLSFPAPQCLEYLGKLIPLLEQAVSVKANLTENLLLHDRLWVEAGYAAAYNEQAGAVLMQRIARHTALLASLRSRAELLGQALVALGDPPDARLLQEAQGSRHGRAMAALERLLAGAPVLEGAYALEGGYNYGFYNDDPKKPHYSGFRHDSTLVRDVRLPFKSLGNGLVLYYSHTQREKSGAGSGSFAKMDLGFGDEEYAFQALEQQGDAWVSYELDEDDPTGVTATFFYPGAEALLVDSYTLRKGRLHSADRKEWAREPLDASVPLYPAGKSRAALDKEVSSMEGELRQAVGAFQKARQRFSAFLAAGGVLPEMPRHGEHELYWVLKKSSLRQEFPATKVLEKTQDLEVRLSAVDFSAKSGVVRGTWQRESVEYDQRTVPAQGRVTTRPDAEYVPDPGTEFNGTNDPKGKLATTRVAVRSKKEKFKVETLWSPAPLIIPDGGYWPLQLKGSGPWTFHFNHSTDKRGMPDERNLARTFARSDSLHLLSHEPSSEELSLQSILLPDDASLMSVDALGQGGSQRRWVLFGSAALAPLQQGYPLTLTLRTEAGWCREELLYELRILSQDEAAELLNRTAAQDADMSKALAAVRSSPKGSKAKGVVLHSGVPEATPLQERQAFHQANIEFCSKELAALESEAAEVRRLLTTGEATPDNVARLNQLEFRMTCTRSNSIAEQDRLEELRTGKPRFSRTPFDELCQQQVRHQVQEEMREFDRSARAHNKAELLLSKLEGVEKAKARDLIEKTIREGGALQAARWEKLNGALQNLYQGRQDGELASLEEEVAWKSCQVEYVENVKTISDTGMTLLSLTGGPIAATALYQTGSGFVEGGLLEGVKRGVSTLSDAADVAISGYEGWKSGGWLGMVESASWSVLMNKGPEVALNRLKLRGMQCDGEVAVAKASAAKAPAPTAAAKSAPAQPRPAPINFAPIRAAQFQQELEYGESLAEDFFRSHMEWRKASLGRKASPEEVARMGAEVRRKAASVAHSMTAKSYLKYKAEPIKGKAYTEAMDGIMGDVAQLYHANMGARGYNRQNIYSCRNASSTDTGMDIDVAVREQKMTIPVKGPKGEDWVRDNRWLTKNREPVSVRQYQDEGNQALSAAYKKVTGGYHAKSSFIELTTSANPESYKDLTWLKLPKVGAHGDAAQVNRKLDQFFGKVKPEDIPHSLGITGAKAEIMYRHHPELRTLGSMMESCRGAAKDLDTKFIPLIEHRLRELEAIPAAKRTGLESAQIREFRETRAHLGECLKCFKDIGQARLMPYEWERQFKLVTGGTDVQAVIRRLTRMTLRAAPR